MGRLFFQDPGHPAGPVFRHGDHSARACDALLELCEVHRNARKLCVTAAVVCLDPKQDQRRVEAALATLQRGLARGASSFLVPDFMLCAGQVLYRNGRYEAALSALSQSEASQRIRIRPESDESRLWIRTLQALCLRALGRTVEAGRAIQSVADRIPPLPKLGEPPRYADFGDGMILFWIVVREIEGVFGRPLMIRATP